MLGVQGLVLKPACIVDHDPARVSRLPPPGSPSLTLLGLHRGEVLAVLACPRPPPRSRTPGRGASMRALQRLGSAWQRLAAPRETRETKRVFPSFPIGNETLASLRGPLAAPFRVLVTTW